MTISSSKYGPLEDWFGELPALTREVMLDFEQIESIIEDTLPPSAHIHPAWWANEREGSHVHARAWMRSGWKVDGVDFQAKSVRFVRSD